MLINVASFTPLSSLLGGLIIGTSVAVLVLFNGRIAGISGILGGLFKTVRTDYSWRLSFLAGLILAPVLARGVNLAATVDIQSSWTEIFIAGFLVGIGTRYASGCTSGHGVCGLSRGSARSLVATATFMAAGFITVFVERHVFGG